MTRRAAAPLCLVVTLVLLPTHASADGASEAELHFNLGSELYRQRRYAEAVEHFIASHRLSPNANVVFNVAQTYGLMGRQTDAFQWYQTYLGFDTLDAAGRERGRRALGALASKVAVLEVAASTDSAELFVDGADSGSVGKAPRQLAVAPGSHTVIARLPGFRDAQAAVTVETGGSKAVSLELVRKEGQLVVTSAPAGARVVRADTGEELGRTPLERLLPAGELHLSLRAEGRAELERTAQVLDGETTRLDVTLELEAPPAAAQVVGSPEVRPVSGLTRAPKPGSLNTFVWLTGAAGLAIGVAGTAMLIGAGHEYGRIPALKMRQEVYDARDRGVALQGGGWVAVGLGAALLVTAVVIALWPQSSLSSDAPPTAGGQR